MTFTASSDPITENKTNGGDVVQRWRYVPPPGEKSSCSFGTNLVVLGVHVACSCSAARDRLDQSLSASRGSHQLWHLVCLCVGFSASNPPLRPFLWSHSPLSQRQGGMRPRCGHHGCIKQPSYGVDGSNRKEFCPEHKRDGMVDLKHKRCGHHGCGKRPSYGADGSNKVEFCFEHKRDGMVDLKSKKCMHHGCTKRPSYGADGSKKVEFCSEHKRDGMVDLKSKKCMHHGCTKQPSYGADGSNKKEFCSEHKRDGMVDLKNRKRKRCGHHGCNKLPSYGVDGSNSVEFCSGHKRGAMVDLRSKRCLHQGCNKWPSYGVDGSKKVEFCSEHKRGGMVDLIHKRCLHHGCSKHPSFGADGSNKREFCCEHKRDGMVHMSRNSPSVDASQGNEQGRRHGGGSAADDGGTECPAGADRSFHPIPSTSAETPSASSSVGNKRSRLVRTSLPPGSTAVKPGGYGGVDATELRSFSEPENAAVKQEAEAFSVGRRGGWW